MEGLCWWLTTKSELWRGPSHHAMCDGIASDDCEIIVAKLHKRIVKWLSMFHDLSSHIPTELRKNRNSWRILHRPLPTLVSFTKPTGLKPAGLNIMCESLSTAWSIFGVFRAAANDVSRYVLRFSPRNTAPTMSSRLTLTL